MTTVSLQESPGTDRIMGLSIRSGSSPFYEAMLILVSNSHDEQLRCLEEWNYDLCFKINITKYLLVSSCQANSLPVVIHALSCLQSENVGFFGTS